MLKSFSKLVLLIRQVIKTDDVRSARVGRWCPPPTELSAFPQVRHYDLPDPPGTWFLFFKVKIMSMKLFPRHSWRVTRGSRIARLGLSPFGQRWGSSLSQRPGSDRYKEDCPANSYEYMLIFVWLVCSFQERSIVNLPPRCPSSRPRIYLQSLHTEWSTPTANWWTRVEVHRIYPKRRFWNGIWIC